MQQRSPQYSPTDLPDGHQCSCEHCTPGLKLEGPRLDEHHYSVRFGHENYKPVDNPMVYFPIFQRQYQPGAVEDYCHPTDGWVLRQTSDPPHVCQRCDWKEAKVCLELVHGDFMMLILQQDEPKVRVDGGAPEDQPISGTVTLQLGDEHVFQVVPDANLPLPTVGERCKYEVYVNSHPQHEFLHDGVDGTELLSFRLAGGRMVVAGSCAVMRVSPVRNARIKTGKHTVEILIASVPEVKVG